MGLFKLNSIRGTKTSDKKVHPRPSVSIEVPGDNYGWFRYNAILNGIEKTLNEDTSARHLRMQVGCPPDH